MYYTQLLEKDLYSRLGMVYLGYVNPLHSDGFSPYILIQ